MTMLPTTVNRVPEHTADEVNERIRRRTEENVRRHVEAGPGAIDRRLAELDREWDIERALEANAATAVLAGLTLGTAVDRRWFVLPALVGGFLLMHAVQGWCPPLPLLRRLGFRTPAEIEKERFALKAARGDFRNLPNVVDGDDRAAIDRLADEGGPVSGPVVSKHENRSAVSQVLDAVHN
jgi:hypothetical protein